MMNDKELLELAAKAAGYRLANTKPGYPLYVENGIGIWNPLTDDGDALRLAVGLKFGISIPVHKTICADVICFLDSSVNVREGGTDPYAATRRAIVRAAAEIGKGE